MYWICFCSDSKYSKLCVFVCAFLVVSFSGGHCPRALLKRNECMDVEEGADGVGRG